MSASRNTIPLPYRDRIARVRDQIQRHKLDGYLVSDRMDQIWLTGFTGESGAVLVTERQVVLLTDGRFDETAEKEAPWARKVVRKKRSPDVTARELRRYRLSRVGFDPQHVNVTTYAGLRSAAKPTRMVSTTDLIGVMRLIKDASEIAKIRRSIDIAERVFRRIKSWMRPGMTERSIAAKLTFEMQSAGAQGSAFTPIVAVGANGSLPHYEPGDTKVTASDGVLIDWGARCDWYISDLTRMIWPGSVPRRMAKVQAVVAEAHDTAIAAIRAGITAGRVDAAARRVITKAGFGTRFTHALGHGIGLDVHEAPRVGKESDTVLQSGMIVTIEPGVYLPGVGGVRLESDVLVTDGGAEVLSSLPF